MALYIIDNSQLPNWSDALQTFIGIIGIPLTIYTLWKLVKKDKEREAEIASLAIIAEQLKEMMVHNKNVFIDSKKPHIEFGTRFLGHNTLKVSIKNVNPHCTLTNFIIPNVEIMEGAITTITADKATQQFFINVNVEKVLYSAPRNIELVYYIDDTFKYSQTITVSFKKVGEFDVVGGIILGL